MSTSIVVDRDCKVPEIVAALKTRPSFWLLSDKIGELSEKLGASQDSVENVKNRLSSQQCNLADGLTSVIQEWSQRCGDDATLQDLIAALQDSNLHDCGKALEDAFPPARYCATSKYLRPPLALQDFLDSTTPTSDSVLILASHGTKITCEKIYGNEKLCEIHQLENLIELISRSKLDQKLINVVSSESFESIRDILTKRPKQCRMVIVTLHSIANQFRELAKGDISLQATIKISEDTLEWGDLRPEQKDFVKEYLSKNIHVVLGDDKSLDEILTEEVLVDLVNERCPTFLKETLPAELNCYISRKVQMRKFISTAFKEKTLTEEAFLGSLDDNSTGPVCICGGSGSGKTTFLVRIGKLIKEQNPLKTVIFLPVNFLMRQVKAQQIEEKTEEVITSAIENIVCANNLGKIYLRERLSSKANEIAVELFLDGLDEVSFTDFSLFQNILTTIQSSFKSCRVWITTIPGLLPVMKGTQDVLGVTLKPFDRQDQTRLLVSHWKEVNSELDITKLNVFANHCLDNLQSKIASRDYAIVELPLQCRMIADICQDLAVQFSTAEMSSLPTMDDENIPISNFFQLWITTKLKNSLEERALVESLALVSLEWLFPKWCTKLRHYFSEKVAAADFEDIRKTGLLQMQSSSNSETVPIFHKIPAEYFVAWFVVDKLNHIDDLGTDHVHFFLEELIRCIPNLSDSSPSPSYFLYPGIVHFLNSFLADIPPNPNCVQSLNSFLITHNIVEACANSDLVHLLKFLSQIQCQNEDNSSTIFTGHFIKSGVGTFSLDFFKLILNEYEKYCPLSLAFQTSLFYQSVSQRNLPIINYLLLKPELRRSLETMSDETPPLLHNYLENSSEDSPEMIEQKMKVVRILIGINQGFLEQRNFLERTPLLSVKIHLEFVLELIKLGADVLAQDKYNQTILHRSIDRDHLSRQDYQIIAATLSEDSLQKLVLLKDSNGSTPLGTLIANLDPLPETLDLFKEAGADFNHVNTNKYSILRTAITEERKAETLQKLMECGADPLRVEWENNTILHLMCKRGQLWSEYYHMLIGSIPSDKLAELVKIQNNDGMTPLGSLVAYSDPLPDTIAIFKMANADFNHINKKGYSILGVAVTEGRQAETLAKLVEFGADVTWRKGWRDRNLLHFAGEKGNGEAVKYLVKEKGFDVNEKTRSWQTALGYAENNGHTVTCEVLKELGAT